jgi:hypothetical protein
MAVAKDRSLTDGAVRLYLFLDEYAGWKGSGNTGPLTLAEDLGQSDQEIQRRMKELERAGYVRCLRGHHQRQFCLAWSQTNPDSIWNAGQPTKRSVENKCEPTEMRHVNRPFGRKTAILSLLNLY